MTSGWYSSQETPGDHRIDVTLVAQALRSVPADGRAAHDAAAERPDLGVLRLELQPGGPAGRRVGVREQLGGVDPAGRRGAVEQGLQVGAQVCAVLAQALLHREIRLGGGQEAAGYPDAAERQRVGIGEQAQFLIEGVFLPKHLPYPPTAFSP